MKKIFYVLMPLVAILLFVNNTSGPIVVQQKGYTGAPGDQPNTCRTCHNTGTYGSSAIIEVFDSAGTIAVTKYALGKQYTIRLTISVTSGTPSAYGFQMIDIHGDEIKLDSTKLEYYLPRILSIHPENREPVTLKSDLNIVTKKFLKKAKESKRVYDDLRNYQL